MPRTVNACFTRLNSNLVNIDPKVRDVALSSRDNLIDSLHALSEKGLIPASYSERDVYMGSFARKTKIQPLDDIDLLICFKGCGGSYEIVRNNEEYLIKMPTDAPVLGDLCRNDGTLNSKSLLALVRDNLSNLNDFKKADIHYNKEACTLQLKSYTWNFDIVPCFYTTTDFYLIPDGYGNWKNTDPRKDNSRTSSSNQKNGGAVLQFIRTMKFWKSQVRNPWHKVSSYMFEQMLLDLAEKMEFTMTLSRQIVAAFSYLATNIYKDVADPKGIQGNLNTLTQEERHELSNYANSHFIKANDADIHDVYFDNQEAAIEKWTEVFGEEFPNYD